MTIERSQPDGTIPARSRKRRFTIRALMAAVVVVAAVLGWLANISRCMPRVVAMDEGIARWLDRARASTPGIAGGSSGKSFRTTLWSGADGAWRAEFATTAGKTIAIRARARCTPAWDSRDLTIESGSRTLREPIGARGEIRPIDLREAFPDAFR